MQPPGVRTTLDHNGKPGLGGTWEHGHRQHGGSVVHVDFHLLFGELSPTDASLLRAELKEKLHDAEAGLLKYGEKSWQGDVCVMEIAPMILELRFDDCEHYNQAIEEYETRKIRLYFSEPASVDSLLVMLSLRSKVPGPLGLMEQNQHAKEAEMLAYQHSSYKGIA